MMSRGRTGDMYQRAPGQRRAHATPTGRTPRRHLRERPGVASWTWDWGKRLPRDNRKGSAVAWSGEGGAGADSEGAPGASEGRQRCPCLIVVVVTPVQIRHPESGSTLLSANSTSVKFMLKRGAPPRWPSGSWARPQCWAEAVGARGRSSAPLRTHPSFRLLSPPGPARTPTGTTKEKGRGHLPALPRTLGSPEPPCVTKCHPHGD